MAKYCSNCGKELAEGAQVCLNCGIIVDQKVKQQVNPDGKSKIAAGLFGIFLGALGVHNFYLGYNGKATAQLLITILSCGILSVVSAIWGLIEGVMILSGNITTDADGNYLRD